MKCVRLALVGALATDNGARCAEKNFQIEPGRPFSGIAKVEPDHFVERDSAASIDLPETGDAGLHFQNPAAMPGLISSYFIGNRRSRSDQRHLTPQHIEELRQFVQAGTTQERADARDPIVLGQLVNAGAIAITVLGLALRLAGDQLAVT